MEVAITKVNKCHIIHKGPKQNQDNKRKMNCVLWLGHSSSSVLCTCRPRSWAFRLRAEIVPLSTMALRPLSLDQDYTPTLLGLQLTNYRSQGFSNSIIVKVSDSSKYFSICLCLHLCNYIISICIIALCISIYPTGSACLQNPDKHHNRNILKLLQHLNPQSWKNAHLGSVVPFLIFLAEERELQNWFSFPENSLEGEHGKCSQETSLFKFMFILLLEGKKPGVWSIFFTHPEQRTRNASQRNMY